MLAVESSLCFVAGVVRVVGLADFVVAGVHIHPHESWNAPGKYCDIMADISEAVGRLLLAYTVPSSQVLLLGDWNAHVARFPYGEVVSEDFGDCGGL